MTVQARPASAEPLVRFEGVTCGYDGEPVLRDLDLTIAQGAFVGIVGTTIGLVLGLGTAIVVDRTGWITIDPSIYFIDHLPVHVELLDVGVVVIASVALAVLATIAPSRRAAR